MFRPTHIFFDLDHTLWDYDTNAEETIRELLVSYRPLIGAEMPFDVFYPIYLGHNHRLWERYRKNEIDNLTLRYQRWEDAFHDLGVARAEWMRQIGEDFLAICPRKKALLPNAVEVLDLIAENYPLHLITNGFAPIQDVKLECSGLRDYFDVIMTPDACGYKKPHPQIFHDALNAANCPAEQALFVGDSYAEDIEGGSKVGMDVVFFNPKAKENPGRFPEIRDLLELLPLVGLG
ncbi:MAG: HAD-IA family hydrolase [Bacteroidia bacterium]